MRGREEVVVPVLAEMLERSDRHDPVDGLVELLPAPQQYPPGARAVGLSEHLFYVLLLILREGQPDDVDVILLGRAHYRRPPAAADVEQRHARFEAKLAQRQVDLRDLRLLERHAIPLEKRAT